MEKLKISIIICTYNRVFWLEKCLDSVIKQNYSDYEIIVVYFDAKDGTKDLLEKYPVKAIEQTELSGWSAACNIGIEASNGEIIAFIDDDVIVQNDWLQKLSKAYENHDVSGVGGPVYKLNSKEFQYKKPKINKYGDFQNASFNSKIGTNEFLFLAGGNMSFKKEVLNKVKGFDPYFTYGYGETDLCVRITNSGYKLLFDPNVIVWHANAEGSV